METFLMSRHSPEYFEEALAEDLRSALQEETKGANSSASYKGSNTYLVIGMCGKFTKEANNNAEYVKGIAARALDCDESSIKVSEGDDDVAWYITTRVTRETDES